VPSRDRKGADNCGTSKLFCNEQIHALALLFDYVLDSLPYILILPQPSRASMPRPASSIWSAASEAVQLAARVGFELVHDSFRSNLGFYDGMHMVGSYMRGQQVPTAVGTMRPQTREHNRSALPVEHIGTLEHSLTLQDNALWIGVQEAASYQIVTAIHRAQFGAM